MLALAAEGTTDALIMLVIVILANGLLQNIVQPIAFGATLDLNPLVVLIVTIGFGSIFGMIGMILAAPLTSAALHISRAGRCEGARGRGRRGGRARAARGVTGAGSRNARRVRARDARPVVAAPGRAARVLVTVPRLVGVLAGFGAGALISAVSFDLIEAEELAAGTRALDACRRRRVPRGRLRRRAPVRERRDWRLDGDRRRLRRRRRSRIGHLRDPDRHRLPHQPQLPRRGVRVQRPAGGRALGESPCLGLELPPARGLWALVVLACGVAAALGFLLADQTGAATGDRMAALAAGGLLAMLTNSLMPFAYERAGSLAGVATVVGFCVSLLGT